MHATITINKFTHLPGRRRACLPEPDIHFPGQQTSRRHGNGSSFLFHPFFCEEARERGGNSSKAPWSSTKWAVLRHTTAHLMMLMSPETPLRRRPRPTKDGERGNRGDRRRWRSASGTRTRPLSTTPASLLWVHYYWSLCKIFLPSNMGLHWFSFACTLTLLFVDKISIIRRHKNKVCTSSMYYFACTLASRRWYLRRFVLNKSPPFYYLRAFICNNLILPYI